MTRMFRKLLIANRGECACRIAQTAKRLGVRTVAVYSEADDSALHKRVADEALLIGPAPAIDSYLSIERVIDAAVRSNADALHPGYGFLAEDPKLADACARRGIVFVGPSAAAMKAMASKDNAKILAEAAGVPILPWAYVIGSVTSGFSSELTRTIGFPLLLKATAGGGGRGMRVAHGPEELAKTVAEAESEALRAFGNGNLIAERFIPNGRHVEVQVFGDSKGNVVHLFDRECSIQRRYQKIVEEAPATRLLESTRQAMRDAATRLAIAIGYEGAGTVEFLVDPSDQDQSFYFLEMNTRLQVEHPVTELTTGLDLVEWQLRVAAGEGLPLSQSEIWSTGHAIEVRLYAEDPSLGFMPSPGRLGVLEIPTGVIRSDMGYESGDMVPDAYDPMIGKLVSYGSDRQTALATLDDALRTMRVDGIQTNASFLAGVVRQPSFVEGVYDTSFIAQLPLWLTEDVKIPAPREVLVMAALFELHSMRTRQSARSTQERADRFSPWDVRDGWLLNAPAMELLRFTDAFGLVEIKAHPSESGYRLQLSGPAVEASAEVFGSEVRASIDGSSIRGWVIEEENGVLRVSIGGGEYELRKTSAATPDRAQVAVQGDILAAMPGMVLEVFVTEGDTVDRGEPLVALESMKMVYTITASDRCTVRQVAVDQFQQVHKGDKLIAVSQG
ncbi:MAG: ATP-grasp domain-containing protein [SAR202 cluster bacterium]|nr:ATP-grasp domain-containing protein [SAR202 cluster bacterium]|tara:strand:+ start:3822 stop:5840 length:2019 start_codon:yes stop_codon:yes gene_type:complete